MVTTGEPAGIGPDICVRLAQDAHTAELVVAADQQLLQERAALLGLPLRLDPFDPSQAVRPHEPGRLKIIDIPLRERCEAGKLNKANAAYVIDTLREAAHGCMSRRFDAMVTGPVHKGIINDSGMPFSGHTEFLAEISQTPQVVMMLTAKDLRVALVTTHVALREVSRLITVERVDAVLQILLAELRGKYGIKNPRVLVCGLNPHAGEDGHLGREDVDIIAPVLETLRTQGALVTGPVPADTAFIPKRLREVDAVLTMYHDQGLPVLKYAGFGNAVNVTLGLPFIRTSVDHGTALELAGTGHADPSSLFAAVNEAIAMSRAALAH